MADTPNNVSLDIYEQALIMSAIKTLLPDLHNMELNPHAREKTITNAHSVLKKLDCYETTFSGNEVFLMYLALDYMRNTLSEVISSAHLSEPDREKAWKTRREANQVIRKIKTSYALSGRDFEKDFDLGLNLL